MDPRYHPSEVRTLIACSVVLLFLREALFRDDAVFATRSLSQALEQGDRCRPALK